MDSPSARPRAASRAGRAVIAVVAAIAPVAACDKAQPEERRRVQDVSVAPPQPRRVALAKLPGLLIERPPWAERDCRLSSVLRARFGRVEVEPCGALTYEASREALDAARACVERAVTAGRPFVYEQQVAGTDSAADMGLLGVIEQGKLVTYEAHHDSDPCGGDCPERGHTRLSRCQSLGVPETLDGWERYVGDAYRCNEPTLLEDCVFGGKRR